MCWLDLYGRQLKFQRNISVAMGSQHQAEFPSLKHQTWERNPNNIHINLKSSGVSIYQGEKAGDAESLEGPMQKIHLKPLNLLSGRGRVE